jgi:1,4-dihydroxy-2-naphthoate octaprenyltransferase
MIELFLTGIRPKTLVAAIIPPIAAHSLYLKQFGETNYPFMLLCLALALFIQMATNFYNDGIDFKKGADADRDGPKRITDSKNIGQVFVFGHICLVMGLACGVPLVIHGGPIFAGLGLLSMFLAYGYTGGPFPLAYLGLGELFVFLFFGLLATCGSYYLFSNTITWASVGLGCIIGFFSCVLIAINNLRDKDKDKLVGKRTLATRISSYRYLKLLDLFLFFPYLILFFFVCFIDLKYCFPLLAAGLAHQVRFIYQEYSEPSELNNALAKAGKHLLVFGLLFVLSSTL